MGVALIVALSTGVTYWLIYNQLEQRAMERLQEYFAAAHAAPRGTFRAGQGLP